MADAMFEVEELGSMKRAQLQKLCKKVGIKANSKTSELIEHLREYAKENFMDTDDESKTESIIKEDKQDSPNMLDVQVIEPVVNPPSRKSPRLSSNAVISQDNKECSNYKEQVMKQLEKKVQETLKSAKYECKIPRFTQFAKSTKDENNTPNNGKDWSGVHSHLFKKMDSIDVYLEKKRKRTQSFYQNVKKAKKTASEAKSVFAEMKTAHNTPAKMTSRKSIGKQYLTGSKSVKIASPSVGFNFRKSPKAFKPMARDSTFIKQKTPSTRKSVAFTTSRNEENKAKTPGNGISRKSIAGTPFRYSVVNMSNVQASETKSKPKFDLKASLAKPLGYAPHTGKLKTPLFVKKETTIVDKKQLVAKPKVVVDHRVDIKNVKVTSRADRRKADMKNKASKRKDTMARRRGLPC